MALKLSDAFFPSAKRMREMTEGEKMTIVTAMCAALGATAITASNVGDYYASEKDLAAFTPEQAAATSKDYIEHFNGDLGIGEKVMNYGLYRSAKNHVQAE